MTKYRFLEHGAFWAIIALGLIMLLSAKFHISESITGLIGAVLIGISLLWSMRYNRKHGTEREEHMKGWKQFHQHVFEGEAWPVRADVRG